MAHANTNFKTKKALKEAVAAGEQVGIHSPARSLPVRMAGST